MTEIVTFGCRLNTYESEVMRGHVAAAAAAGVAGPEPVETVIVNTCAVTAEAERQGRQAVRRLHRDRPNAAILVTGCAAQIAPARWAALPGVRRVLGNAEKLRADSWRADTWGVGTATQVADIRTAAQAPAPPVTEFAGRARAFVQVQQGCDHRCTFCVIPQGRGRNRSVPLAAIVAQARSLLASGYRELVLTGVDIASYGQDLPDRPSLGQLCADLLAALPDLTRLRLSSIDPAAIDPALWRLIAEEPRLMPHLHLSMQAGADLILKRMRRRHSRAQGLDVIARARRLRPDMAFGADLIAGFPTETEALFEETRQFVAEAGLAFLHVFPYSERPGTPAARMPPVPAPLRRERAARLRAAGAAAARAFHATQPGRTLTLLMETPTEGRAEHFARVRLARPQPPGTLLAARVTAAHDDHLLAEPA